MIEKVRGGRRDPRTSMTSSVARLHADGKLEVGALKRSDHRQALKQQRQKHLGGRYAAQVCGRICGALRIGGSGRDGGQ